MRYDSLMSNFRYPEGVAITDQTLGDWAEFTFNGYIPYFGLMLHNYWWNSMAIKAGVVGFPALPGAFEYTEYLGGTGHPVAAWSNEFRSGYFIEAFAEATKRIRGWASIGAFAKYTSIAASATAKATGHISTNPPAATIVNRDFDFKFARENVVVGGLLNLFF
jgi:hypothetical protein